MQRFPEYLAITSPNGAGSPHKACWKALKDRHVIIWPDNDDEGQRYADHVARILYKVEAASVKIAKTPDDFPEKWDLADDYPDGVDAEILQTILGQSQNAPDIFHDMVKGSKNNAGLPFEVGSLRALTMLKQDDPAHYEAIRRQLKQNKVRVTELDEHMRKYTSSTARPQKDHLDYAQDVIQIIGAQNILSSHSHVWRWSKTGVWQPLPDRALKQNVQNALAQNQNSVLRGLIDAVCDVLKTEIYQDEHDWNQNPNIINMLNGELHYEAGHWVLKPHQREHYRTTQIPLAYNPDADAPRFKQFLREIFAGDADADCKQKALLELIGYTLVSHARYEKFALLIGGGANGKSVVLDVVKALVGKDNVAAVQPSEFSNKFQRAHLHMKLANLVTEIKEGGQMADSELKAITTGELTTAEHKNKNPFDFEPFCTCWFGTNHMPHTRDHSDALFRRAVILTFNNTFIMGVNADPDLKPKLLNELQGILNLALAAYLNVVKAKAFTDPQSSIEAKAAWKKDVDQVAQFIEERCTLDNKHEISSKALYADYKDWASESGISRTLNRKNFTNRLKRHGCDTKRGTAGKRMIAGVRIGWEA